MDQSIKKTCYGFFAGKAGAEDSDRLLRFLEDSPDNKALFSQWENEWYAEEVPSFAQLNSFAEIRRRIRKRRLARALKWSAAAACVAGIIAAALTLIPTRTAPKDAEQMLCIVETGFREKTKVVLPDSTQVWLNSASRISYNKDFLSGDRVVDLEGEAFFDVKKYQGRPFTVNLAGSEVRVLGTKFNVSSFRKENLCEVALLEGSVEFTTPGTKVEMVPGDILIMDRESGGMEKLRGDVRKDMSWMSGKLDYTKITMGRLLRRLSSIYGVDISYIPGKHADSTFGVILNLDEPLPGILDGLSLIQPVRWKMEEDGSITVNEQ